MMEGQRSDWVLPVAVVVVAFVVALVLILLLKKLMRFLLAVRLAPEFIFGRMLFGYGERP